MLRMGQKQGFRISCNADFRRSAAFCGVVPLPGRQNTDSGLWRLLSGFVRGYGCAGFREAAGGASAHAARRGDQCDMAGAGAGATCARRHNAYCVNVERCLGSLRSTWSGSWLKFRAGWAAPTVDFRAANARRF